MKILFDQGTPVPLRRHLHPHEVDTAAELGWSELENGALLARADEHGYDLMIMSVWGHVSIVVTLCMPGAAFSHSVRSWRGRYESMWRTGGTTRCRVGLNAV